LNAGSLELIIIARTDEEGIFMKSRCFLFALLVVATFGLCAHGAEVSKVVTLDELEDVTLKVGGIKFNNFVLREDELSGEQMLEAKVNVRTKEMKQKYTPVAVYVSATDSSGKLVACFCLSDWPGLKANDSEELDESGSMPKGQLKRVQKIQIRIIIEE
jgi:hypothetical protein